MYVTDSYRSPISKKDDIQITKNGPVNLMSKIPIEAEEIEQIMNR